MNYKEEHDTWLINYLAPAKAVYTDDELYAMSTMIHCDEYVLHAPGKCEYCDEHGFKQQRYRINNNINFTGEKNPNKRPCPAELIRGDLCQVWGGNVPVPPND